MQLPSGAQTWRSCGWDVAWTDGEHIAAFLADAIQIGNWQRGDGKGPKPKPFPRPGDKARADRRSVAIEAKAKAFAARHAAPPTPKQPRDARGRFVKREGT